MIDAEVREQSHELLLAAMTRFSDAGASIIQVRTRELMRAARVLREWTSASGTPYHEWSTSTGYRDFTSKDYVDNTKKGDDTDFGTALSRPLLELRNSKSEVRLKTDTIHYFAFIDPEPHIRNNPFVLDMIEQYASILPTANVAIIFITPDAPMDSLSQGTCLVTELPTPTVSELENVMRQLLIPVERGDAGFKDGHDLDDEAITRIAVMGLGLTMYEFETHAALAVTSQAHHDETRLTADCIQAGVAAGKTEVVRSSELLELMQPEDMSNVGGMERLKDWLNQRAACYTQEARDAGVEVPKGFVLVGAPGTGKSLVGKSCSSLLGVPLVRLNFANVFSKYVGESEQRVRAALKMVESMAPVVLFVDEIDKGLGGTGAGGGDGGTSLRVLGTYLTWLQELTVPVFSIVTANRVDGLPPELLRRGRFDQIFSVAMPDREARKKVLEIHLRKRGHSIAKLSGKDVSTFLDGTENFVPAEIESVVKDAIVAAFSKGEELSARHLIAEISNVIPLFKSQAEAISRIISWADNNAIPVSYRKEEEEQDEPEARTASPAARSSASIRRLRSGGAIATKRK
jgi:AAA+ superfamily predicted ATPase